MVTYPSFPQVSLSITICFYYITERMREMRDITKFLRESINALVKYTFISYKGRDSDSQIRDVKNIPHPSVPSGMGGGGGES